MKAQRCIRRCSSLFVCGLIPPPEIAGMPRMSTTAAIAVTDSDVAAFRADGAVLLRGFFSDWVETLRAGVARNIASPSADARIYAGSPGKGRHFGDYCNWDRIPEFRRFIFQSPAARTAARLMGARAVRLFHEHV